jgi:hypothetical protein
MSHPKHLIGSAREECKGCGCYGECEAECERIPEWFKYSEDDWESVLNKDGLCPCCVHDRNGDESPRKPEN